MDAFVTYLIVAIAMFWGATRLWRRFSTRTSGSSPACGSCSGCGVASSTRGCPVSPRRRTSPFFTVLIALAFTASLPGRLDAQEALEERTDEDPALIRGLETFKSAFESASGGLSIDGFFEMQVSPSHDSARAVRPGDFEIDLSRELGEHAQLAAAIVTNDEGTNLTVGYLDVHFFGGLIAPRGKLPREKGFHVQIGRFDVPFGNDWQYFAPKDRLELSAPLTTEAILEGGGNDAGIRVLGSNGSVNYSVFLMRGAGPGRTIGGRIGISPFDDPYRFEPRVHIAEGGVSFVRDLDGDGKERATFIAFDSEVHSGRWHVRAEHVRNDARPSEELPMRVASNGWHVTTALDAGEIRGVAITPYARFDTVSGNAVIDESAARMKRVTTGINSNFLGVFLLKLEHARLLSAPGALSDEDRVSWSAQMVVVF